MQRINQQAVRLLAGVFVWPRHWLSWVVGVVMTAAMVLINVPGTPSTWHTHRKEPAPDLLRATIALADGSPAYGGSAMGPDPPWPHYVTCRFHGWPLTHGVTAVGYGGEGAPSARKQQIVPFAHYPGGWPISWAYRDAWPLAVDASQLRVGALMINLTVALAICLACGLAAEHWLRARKSLWRVRLIDLLAATTVIAVGLGWAVYHKQRYAHEQSQIDDAFVSKGLKRGYPGPYRYDLAGPVCLTKLLGSEEYLFWRLVLSDKERPDRFGDKK